MSRGVLSPAGLSLRYHTAKRMRPRQLLGIGERTVRELLVPRLPVDFDRVYDRRVPDNPDVRLAPLIENTTKLRESLDETTRSQFRAQAGDAADGAPTFLNRTLRIADGDGVSWYDDRFDDLPLLWALKLYAFQPLQWVCASVDPKSEQASRFRSAFDDWIRDWIATAKIGSSGYLRRAWTPWAVSLRILHLSRYLAWRSRCETTDDTEFERGVGRELYKNALFLANHIEHDVGGNHLVENGAAMVVAGVLFEHREWRTTGQRVLATAADRQFLDDGYHFERSPMYHVLVLTRYLTVCHLLRVSGHTVPTELHTTAQAGSEFLEFLRPPNDGLPLLNDSVHGQALPLADCLSYAATLGFETTDQWSSPTGSRRPADTSGYHWLRTDAGAMLVDGGIVGPPHLPGHSHSDTLSLLLWVDGQQVLTDTGTFGYVGGLRRDYARGARGHNTVTVGGSEPIAVGGKYLMGPRPAPETRFQSGTVTRFEGRYRAKPYRDSPYTHKRNVYADDDWWLLEDVVDDCDGRAVRGRLHLHPDVEAKIEASGRVRLGFGADERAFVVPGDRTNVAVTTGPYFPRFGESERRAVLEFTTEDPSDTRARLRTLLTPRDVDPASVTVTSEHSGPARLTVGDRRYDLPDSSL